MKPPYYRIHAVCKNTSCAMTTWYVDRKKPKPGSDGTARFAALSCPICHQWSSITKKEEITDVPAKQSETDMYNLF